MRTRAKVEKFVGKTPVSLRTPAGRFSPGHSGNPGGKNGYTELSISEALRRQLAAGAAIQIATEMVRIALHAKHENHRVAAAELILDRVEGKAIQAVRIDGHI